MSTDSFLEALGARTGIKVEFYDPTGSRYGFPTFPYRYAPDGLATRRQLRRDGLRPNGQDRSRKSSGGTANSSASPSFTAAISQRPNAPPRPRSSSRSARPCVPAAPVPPAASSRTTTSRAGPALASTATEALDENPRDR